MKTEFSQAERDVLLEHDDTSSPMEIKLEESQQVPGPSNSAHDLDLENAVIDISATDGDVPRDVSDEQRRVKVRFICWIALTS